MMAASEFGLWMRRLQGERGLRASIAVGTAMLVCHGFGLPATAAALGAFNPLLVDNGGPYRIRLNTMLITILGGAAAFVAGALMPPELLVIVPATMAVAFLLTFMRVLSQPLASSSVLILVLYFAGVGGREHGAHGAVMAAIFVLAGGAWALTLSLLLWPVDPFRPARLAVALCYRSMAEFTATLGGSEVSGVDSPIELAGFAWRRVQRARLEEARLALSETAARAPTRTIRARNLTVLLETSDMLVARTMRVAELKAAAGRLGLGQAEELAGSITTWLADAELAVARALEHRPADAGAAFAHDGSLRVQYILWREDELRRRAALAREDALSRHLAVEERDALLEMRIAFDAMWALWTGNEMPASNFVRVGGSETPVGWLDALRANTTMQSAAFRHALRLMVVSAVDVVMMRLIHVNHGFWLPMTSIILMQPYSAGTVRKSVQRVTGTVAGGVLAAVLAAAISSTLAMIAVVTLLSGLTLATFAVDYAVYCLFLTPTFVLLSLPHPHDWQYAGIRVGLTLIGAAIAVTAMRLLWPERAEEELGRLLRRGTSAGAAYLRAMLAFWEVPPEGRREAERVLLAPARRLCGLASNDAEEAVDRVMQEPHLRRKTHGESDARAEALTFSTYLRRLTQSVTTLALVGRDSPAVRVRLERAAGQLERLAAGEAGLAASGEVERGGGVDLAEEQVQRIERQVQVLEKAAAWAVE